MKKAILNPATANKFIKGCTFVTNEELNQELIKDSLGEKFETFEQMVDHCTELAEPKLKSGITKWSRKFVSESSKPKAKKPVVKKADTPKVEKPKAKDKIKVTITAPDTITDLVVVDAPVVVEAPKVIETPAPTQSTIEPPLKTVGTEFAYRGRWVNVKHRVLSFDPATNKAQCEIIESGKKWSTDVLNAGNFEPKIVIFK